MIATSELHWQAGMFEGEGSIRINKPGKRHLGSLNVDLPNTQKDIVDIFYQAWGGSMHWTGPKDNRKGYWRWRSAAGDSLAFLIAMWPCLVSKKYKDRTVLGIDYQNQKLNTILNRTVEYRETQWWFYNEMRVLNWRGNSPCPNANQHRKRQ